MQIITRAEAKIAGLTRYFTGAACKNRHIAERTVSNSTCCECARLWREAAPAREKKRAYDKLYAVENSKKKVEAAIAWVKNNPDRRFAIVFGYDSRRRVQKESGDSTAAIRDWIKTAKKVCHWCNNPCADDYHVDHYEPLSKGGEHKVSNFVIACPTCNLRKNSKDPYEFAASVGRLF